MRSTAALTSRTTRPESEFMNDARFVKIETKLSFQEATLDKLGEVIRDQQEQLDTLSRALRDYVGRLEEFESTATPGEVPDEKPPHY